jgi:hypothetical protein
VILTRRKLAAALGCGALLPAAVFAQDDYERRREERRERRYYDPEYRDYHVWNEREARAWHRYWAERRREIEWERAKERQRREYWRWRHEHPDY